MKRIFLYCLILAMPKLLLAQGVSASPDNNPVPVTFTAEQDHANMMKQLGIKSLRPGPSGDRKSSKSCKLRRVEGKSLSTTS